jgi:hypothetical protein
VTRTANEGGGAHAEDKPGLVRAIGWVDYYLVMKLHEAARGVLEDLRKRLVYELEHGPSTTSIVDE